MNPIDGMLRYECLHGKDFFICQTIGKIVKGILQQEGVWKVKLETAEGYPEYHNLACPWDSTHALEAKHDGNQKTLACKDCGGLWLAIIKKDSRLEYYPKSIMADFTEEGEIRILESEQVNCVKDTHVDMTTETQSLPNLVESRQTAYQKIQAQIVKGQKLRDQTIHSEDELEKARAESEKWSEYNKQLLSRLFTDSSIADRCWLFHDYTPTINAWIPSERTVEEEFLELVTNYRKRMNSHLIDLEGIRDELPLIPEKSSAVSSDQVTVTRNEVFIVHGRDHGAKETIAREVEKLGLKAVILHEQPNKGRTIIEKLEELAKSASFAIVLLTPDDFGALKDRIDGTRNPRARQNVVFELGYFIGRLGRERVCPIYKGEIESPSDIDGIVYVRMDEAGAWRQDLTQEMESAGLPLLKKGEVPF